MNKHEELIQILAIYDDLNETKRAKIDAHVADCPECAASLTAYQAMDNRLQQLPRLQPEPSFRQDFYTEIESNMTSYKRNKQIRRIPAFAIQIFAIGALILLGFAFWLNLRLEEVPLAAPNIPVTVESTTPVAIGDITFEERSYSPGETVTILIFWHNVQTTGEEMISLRLMDFESSTPIAQQDEPLVISMGVQNTSIHELILPTELNVGAYPLELSVYNQSTGERLPIPTETVTASQPVLVGEAVNAMTPTPILETAVIRLESWSPDSQYLVLREFTETDRTNGAAGSLHVYDTNTGSFCTPGFDGNSWSNDRVWIDDHTLAYINARNEMAIGDACTPFDGFVDLTMSPVQGIMDQSHDRTTLLLHVDNGYLLYHLEDLSRPDITRLNIPDDLRIAKGIFSPDAQHLAFIDLFGTIFLVSTGSGDIVQTVPWQIAGREPDPIWLSNSELLARTPGGPQVSRIEFHNPDPNAVPTPFIVNLAGQITSLESLFMLPINEKERVLPSILAAPDIEQGHYTILLLDHTSEAPAPIRVYNSATGLEVLPFTQRWQDGITEDGRYLLMAEEINQNGAPGINYLVREATAVGEDFETFFMIDGNAGQATSPSEHLQVSTINSGILIDTTTYPIIKQSSLWDEALGRANRRSVLWSPNSEYVAVVSGIDKTNQSQLFVLTENSEQHFSNSTENILIPGVVAGTWMEGLPLRDTPGGELIGTLSEGTPVSILEDVPTQEHNNLTWQKVRTLGGLEGWVVAEFLALDLPEG